MRIVRYERTRHTQNQEGKAPLWLMGVTDLVTLLLAFFILLFATAVPNSDAWNKASDSVRSRFGGEMNGADATGQSGHKDADKTWESEERDPGLNLDYLYSIVRKYVEADPSLKGVTVRSEEGNVILSLGEDLTFAPGQTQVSAQGLVLLRKLSDYLSTLPNTLEVVGYADQLPLRSDEKFNSNWHLSLERAYNVAQALKDRGYEAEIAIRGKGISDSDILLKPTQQDAQAGLARRVDLRLYLLQP